MPINDDDLTGAWAEVRSALDESERRIAAIFETLRTRVSEPDPPKSRLRFATHRYLTTGLIDARASVFDLQDYDGFHSGDYPKGSELYLYATYVKRPSDPDGFTQFMPPGWLLDQDLARYPIGDRPVHRAANGGDYLLDISDPDLRDRMVRAFVNRVVSKGAHGGYMDEVDQQLWGWDDLEATDQIPNMVEWRGHLSALVVELATALHDKKKKLWINLGADYDVDDSWQRPLINIVDGVNVEFFIGRDKVGQGTAIGTDWVSQVEFVRKVELLGKAVHVHASTQNPGVIGFAFCSWLLATQFNGSFTASLNYDGKALLPYEEFVSDAVKLGNPVEAYRPVGGGLQTRKFEHGVVWVNRSTVNTVSGLPPLSGRIELW